MALPVAPTPILESKEADAFWDKFEADLKRPAKYTPTPKIKEVEKLIKKYACEKENE